MAPAPPVPAAWNLVNACFFEYGIAIYDLGVGEALRSGDGFRRDARPRSRTTARRAVRQLAKDFVVWPALSGRGWRTTLTADATAGLLRNVWTTR